MGNHDAVLSKTAGGFARASEFFDVVFKQQSVEKTGSTGFCTENHRENDFGRFAETTVSGNPYETFGSLLCALRLGTGLTLGQVATALGVSKPSVWAWENGRSKPRRDKWCAIAEVLGVDPQVLATAARAEALNKAASSALQVASIDRTGALVAGREMIAKAYGVPSSAVRITIEI